MTAEIVQFVPRPNPKADRAFWIGGDSPIDDTTSYPDPPLAEYEASAGYESTTDSPPIDTTPSEYVAPEGGDCA